MDFEEGPASRAEAEEASASLAANENPSARASFHSFLAVAGSQQTAPFDSDLDVAEELPSNRIQLPVLELQGVVLFPGSTLPLRWNAAATQPQLSSFLQQQQQQQTTTSTNATAPVYIGVLTATQDSTLAAARNRRQSWTRRGMGPGRLRRLSQQLVLELGDLVESSSDDNDNDGNNDEASNQREEEEASSNNNANNYNRRHRSDSQEQGSSARQRRRQRTEANLHDNDTTVGTAAARREQHPHIGRIGTMAIVTYTHGSLPNEQGEWMVTALGTSRFRIESFVHQHEADAVERESFTNSSSSSSRHNTVRQFWVHELSDEPLSLPPLNVRHCLQSLTDSSRHDRVLRALSTVSPVPVFVYQQTWPWKLVADIVTAVRRVSNFAGLCTRIPDSDAENDNTPTTTAAQQHSFLEPLAFSFWMASNMPLSEPEKLTLLEMNSVVERLLYIRRKIADEERIESYIHCKSCGIPLSRATYMFSVGGAEGTAGAYVNEYGCIHQTVTVRQVCENEVWFQGEPESRDSWFDGYSWQIMSCQFCNSHLGWKFRRVDVPISDEDAVATTTPDRPELFYGLSAASIAMHGASTLGSGRIYR